MHIFSEQTFIDMYAEINFKEDAKQSIATCQNTEKKHKVFSQLSAALISVQLKICWIRPHPVLSLLLDAISTTK